MRPERAPRGNGGRLGSVLAAALLLGACTPGMEVPDGAEAPQRRIQEFLEERGERLAAGDVRAYLRPVVGEAKGLERRIARGAARVPLARIHVLVVRADPDPEGDGFPNTEVDFIYQYRGMPPDNLFRFKLLYDLRRRGDSWRIVAARSAGGLPPWATGPVELVHSEHFVAMFRPGLDGVDEVLRTAERAREALADRLTLAPEARHLIVLAGDVREFVEVMGVDAAVGAAAATVFLYRSSTGATIRAENRHIVVNMEAVDRWAGPAATPHGIDRTAEAVLRHELAHLLLAPHTRPWTPGWVVEGSAMYLAEDEWTHVWREGLDAGIFQEMSVLDLPERLADAQAYAYSHAAVLHLVDRFGEARFWTFYREFAQLSTEPAGDDARRATRLLRMIYGISPSELDRGALETIRASA